MRKNTFYQSSHKNLLLLVPCHDLHRLLQIFSASLIPSSLNLRGYQILINWLKTRFPTINICQGILLCLHTESGTSWCINTKYNLVLHVNTEKLQYVSLKYHKLTRENLTYSANVGAVGVYTVLITNRQYSQKFKFGIRVNNFWFFYLSREFTSWCFNDKSSDKVSALRR